MSVDLYLMGGKGLRSLQAVIAGGYSYLINEVCIGRDSRVDNDCSCDLSSLCDVSGLRWRYRSQSSSLPQAEYSLAISWRWLIKDAPNLIIIHDSLLPRYRGFAPLVSQLINGETEIGATAIWGEAEYDTGAIIAQSSIDIQYPIRIHDAIEAVASCYVECLLSIFESLANRIELKSAPQDEALATYSLWRDDDDYWINWHDAADRIARFVDAVSSPYKGAITLCNNKLVTVNQVVALPDVKIENRSPGKVIRIQDDRPVVVCGSGLLLIANAVDSTSGASLLPLKSFRSRFHSASS